MTAVEVTSTRLEDVSMVQEMRLTFSVTNDANASFGMAMNAHRRVCNIVADGLAFQAGLRVGDTYGSLSNTRPEPPIAHPSPDNPFLICAKILVCCITTGLCP